MVNNVLIELFYPFSAQRNLGQQHGFSGGKSVNTAPDWTGHVTSSANHGPKPVLQGNKIDGLSWNKCFTVNWRKQQN